MSHLVRAAAVWLCARSSNALMPRLVRLHLESLEGRRLLAIDSGMGVYQPAGYYGSAPGLSPAQIRHAYAVDQVALAGGVAGDGSGQTVAIINSFDMPTIANDLHAFDLAFGLPDPPSFVTVAQDGSQNLPPPGVDENNQPTSLEIAMDVEWVHAIAPGASILSIEANSLAPSDIVTAINYALSQPNVSVISMSFGIAEIAQETALDWPSNMRPGVTFTASTGDNGQPGLYPAYSPNVLAIGGTTLNVDGSGNYLSESGWSGSGGGISQFEPQPDYQNGVVTQSSTQRTIPDVSFDADPATPVSVYDTFDGNPSLPWDALAGTSLGAPAWAGLIAIADQGRSLAGLPPLDGRFNTLPMLYSLPSADFRDITSGNNGFAAGAGYDLVTGRGTPIANLVVRDLVGPQITGKVFNDVNHSGGLDGGDTGLSGATVFDDLNNNGSLDAPTTTTINSTDVPKTIVDASTVSSNITVSGLASVTTDVNVTLTLHHPSDSNLVIALISPDGTRVPLVLQNASGSNMLGTTFDDQASGPLSSGAAPYSASFKPLVPLSTLNGKNANGTWTLQIIDTTSPNGGTLDSWSLAITSGPDAVTTTAADGTYHFTYVTAGAHHIHEVPPSGYGEISPSGNVYNLTVTADSNFVGQDFGNTQSVYSSSVSNRLLFYKSSPRFDGVGGLREPLPFSDDNAIATDKSAYLPGSSAATFANVSSYTLGINGLMVDLTGTHGAITASDFTFKTGNNNSPSSWTTVAAAATVTTRAAGSLGLPAGGSDRIEITFSNNSIQKTWLEVIVKGNDTLGGNDTNTGLAASSVFFWGNALADNGNTPDDASAYRTSANDELDARNNPKTLIANIPITNLQDYNRDGLVSATDQLASRNNPTTNISGPHILNIGGGGPFAPDAGPAAVPAASQTTSSAAVPTATASSITTISGRAALAPGLSPLGTSPPSLPSGLQSRLQNVLDSPPVVTILHTLEQRDTPASRQILQAVDQIADKYNLHDDVLDGILVDLGLE